MCLSWDIFNSPPQYATTRSSATPHQRFHQILGGVALLVSSSQQHFTGPILKNVVRECYCSSRQLQTARSYVAAEVAGMISNRQDTGLAHNHVSDTARFCKVANLVVVVGNMQIVTANQ